MVSKGILEKEKQITFFKEQSRFPSTRFQGSKLKILDWIWENIQDLNVQSALDAFGGTGSVAYMLKQKGVSVTYNDILKFNWHVARALIENSSVILENDDVKYILQKHRDIRYPNFIQKTFKDIYFTNEENAWLDVVVTNIANIDDSYKQSLAYFTLFQSCIAKRPFNLFHRKNLYLRFNDVDRKFGNKTTWDKPFEEHFRKFVIEANSAVFPNNKSNIAMNVDVFDITGQFDMVYIDTPYISGRGVGVDYLGFYHFLEGLVNYSTWLNVIDYKTKHKRIKGNDSVWTDKNKIHDAFDCLFEKFSQSILVVSYRSDGIPSVLELENIMRKYKRKVREVKRKKYKYVLSNNHSEEVLIIGE